MPSGQPLAPDTHHLIGEPTQAPTIPTNAIVGEVAPHHRGQAAMLVAERPMPVFPAPGSNCGHRAGIPVFSRHSLGPVLRRSAMARRGDARPAGGSANPVRSATSD